MNWIKIACVFVGLALSLSARAQYADVHTAKRRGARIELDGRKLSVSESALLMADVGGVDCSAQWEKARGWRGTGIAMISGGAALAAGGLVLCLAGSMTTVVGASVGALGGAEGAQQGAQAGVPLMRAGAWVLVAGAGISLVGIPVTVVNCARMSRLVDQYNEAQFRKVPPAELQLSLGLTPNGMGLCLTF